jgi:hypothetical protein
MQIRELSNKVTSDLLNESLAKKFGYRINVDRLTNEDLESAQYKLTSRISEFEKNNSFDSVLENHEYQKQRAMLDIVRQAISERKLSPEQEGKKDKYVKGMKTKSSEFKKRYGDKGDQVMNATATKMAKKESVEEAMQVLRTVLSERTLTEGEEEKAELIMASKDMVDRVTGWLEDVASMKSEAMLDLLDSIRDEMGSDISSQFEQSVRPALDGIYQALETNRQSLAQAVSILTGSEPPTSAPMAGEEEALPPEAEAGAEVGGEAAGREMRESVQYSRRLAQILSKKK